MRGLDLLRDLSFDGLALAFLKHLEKVTFVSVPTEKGSSETAARSTGLAGAPHATEQVGGGKISSQAVSSQAGGGKISSQAVSSQAGGGEAAAAASDTTASAAATLGTMLGATITEHRMEQTLIFDRGEAHEAFGGDVAAVPIGEDAAAAAVAGGSSGVGGLGVGVLKGLHVVRHRLTQCTIISLIASLISLITSLIRCATALPNASSSRASKAPPVL